MSFTRYEHSGDAVSTTLAGDITSGDTAATLVAATGWPLGGVGPFWVKIDAGLASEEMLLATSRAGTTLSGFTRGADGTAASAHSAGATVEHVYSATEADDANNLVAQLLGGATTAGEIPLSTGAGTYTLLPAGTNGYPLVAGVGTAAYGQLNTTGIADGAVSVVKLDSEAGALVTQSSAARVPSTRNHQNTGNQQRSSTTPSDLGGSISITVPSWATAAIVRTNFQGLSSSSANDAIYQIRTVLGANNGTNAPLGTDGGTGQHNLSVSYIDKFTGLTPGTYTLKTQIAGDGSGSGTMTVGSTGTFVDFDVEFLPA